jgi:integrase/recombinase XerC
LNNDRDQAEINSYLQYLQTQRKCSAHTVSNYQRDLQQLDSLASEHGAASLAVLSHFDIRRFTSQLHAKGLSPTSIARKLSAWRGFYNWLSEQRTLETNPVIGVKAPKRAKSLPKALSVDDAVHLVTGQLPSHDQTAPEKLCNYAMFEMLYSSGLRVSELTSLDFQYIQKPDHVSAGWIDFDAAEVTVTGKGSKQRSVPVGAAAIEALQRWLAVRSSLAKSLSTSDSSALFLTARGNRMTPRAVQTRLKAHALALGIPANVHPHVLRHSFASHVLQSSGDLRAVQEMLGHASIASTQVYTSLDFQRLAQVYDAAHPRAKKQEPTD